MKRLGVMITAFNEERFIKPVIRQFKDLVNNMVVAISTTPWHGNIKLDRTAELAWEEYPPYQGQWESEAEQRNFCMNQLADCDYVLVCHADTFFTRGDIKKLMDFIQTATERQYDIQSQMYWKDLDTVVEPAPILRAMLIRSDVKFSHNIIIEDMSTNAPVVPDVICHHLSWVKTDKEIKTKIASYGHAQEINPDWFEEVWKKDKDTDFAPTQAGDYTHKAKYSCPDEIRRYFEKS